ncbi:hypothetical protein [Pseudomonas faucium]|uniref:hypothetical protein n=1 Tax=Pseudomonas faucium TaxID=2740518 RepID=UPI001F41C263|nr:hypothetical protein [Pseudomonas faucium]
MRNLDEGIIAAIIINLLIITMIVQCIVAARRTDHFESLFPNSEYIKKNKETYKQAGLIGKMMRTGTISTILAIPSLFIKRNLVKQQEVDNFPTQTKILLITLWSMHITLFSALMLTHFL